MDVQRLPTLNQQRRASPCAHHPLMLRERACFDGCRITAASQPANERARAREQA